MGFPLKCFSPLALRAAALLLLAPSGLTGCRALSPNIAGKSAGEVRRSKSKAVRAHLSSDGNTLLLRFRLKGRDAFATARTASGATRSLTFHDAPADAEKVLGKAGRTVVVLNAEEWSLLSRTIAARLAPRSEKEGTLLLAAGQEVIAHRVGGVAKYTSLDHRPRGLRITRRLNDQEVREEIFQNRGDGLDLPGGHAGPVVVLTGTFPEMVFLDRRTRRMVFLTVPQDAAPVLPVGNLDSGEHLLRQVSSFIWRSHVLAFLRNPFSSTTRIASSTWSVTAAAAHRLFVQLPQGPAPPLADAPEMDPAAWRKTLAGLADCPPSRATLRFRIGGDQFFPDFIQAVQDASSTVDLQMFIFDTDDYAVRMADLLRARSREGVRVRVMLDENASITAAREAPSSPMPADYVAPGDIRQYLRQGSELQLRTTSMSGFTASHTKIIIIDNKTAWLGGMNIGREYRFDWHDLMVEVKGPLVGWIQKDFATSWARAGLGGDLAALRQKLRRVDEPEGGPAAGIAVQPLYTSARRSSIADSQLEAARQCRRSLWVENAYLSDHTYLTELVKARHRGVDVRVIMPADNDNGIMAANNRALIPIFRQHGIRVYLLPGMSHVKAALYDGWACVGSANFDRLSLRVNNEFSIGFDDPATVAALRRELFEQDFARSREVKTPDPVPPGGEFMSSLARSLAGQL